MKFTFKKYHLIFLFLLNLILFTSCSRQGRTVIEGHVYQYGTDTPIPNAKIEFTKFVSGFEFGDQGYYFFIDSLFTDEEGYYKFVYNEDTNGIFFKVNKENYFEVNSDVGYEFPIFSNGGRHTQDIEMDAHAYLNLEIIDDNSIEGNAIRILTGFNNSLWLDITEDLVLNGLTRANKFHNIYYKTNNNNILIQDSIMLSPFDSDTITINF